MSAPGRAKGEQRKAAPADGPTTTSADGADGAGDATAPRYAIGIDLGTTHNALSWVDLAASRDTDNPETTVHGVLPLPQLTAPGTVESLPLLPSFLYLPHADELAPGELALPWASDDSHVVGEMARKRGAATPIRLVSSAKSWLCHPGVDRRAAILPADAPPEVARVSPLQASVHYLTHLRHAWDQAHPDAPFDAQDVTVTIPASFDPAARELTVEAAKAAGYPPPTLLEEPQSALYSWIQASGGGWRKQVRTGDIILVVDVGGGTSDFSLIAVLEREGTLELHRVAVGEHILLGGDNMDLALAMGLHKRLERGQFACLWRARQGGTISLSATELQLFLEGCALVGKVPLSPAPLTSSELLCSPS